MNTTIIFCAVLYLLFGLLVFLLEWMPAERDARKEFFETFSRSARVCTRVAVILLWPLLVIAIVFAFLRGVIRFLWKLISE